MEKKVAIVSGASRGIGREVSAHLSNRGYSVMLLARNEEEIHTLEVELDAAGGMAKAFVTDIREEEAVNAVIGAIQRDFGRVDLLVNNAGLGYFHPTEELTTAEWDTVMEVNVKGSFLLTKAVLPGMKAAGKGHIVAIASDVSKRTFAHGSLYCASKYAQHAYFESVRREVRSLGIKVSVIYPGLVDTYFHPGAPGQPQRATYLQPRDIADAVGYIVGAPDHVLIDELMLHPMSQEW
jgi:NADP-dependent 3-hydroxy acid dehydrogenase YdfG